MSNTRERLEYGLHANDSRGDFARVHTIKVENALSILFEFLSANTSQVKLPKSIPVSVGGTGGTTTQSAKLNLGIFTNTNNELIAGSKAVSVYNGSVLIHGTDDKITISRVGVGNYSLYGVKGFSLFGFKYILPNDEYGVPLCGCEIVFNEANTTATVKVYALNFSNGKYVIDKTKPIDIPNQRCIDISLK